MSDEDLEILIQYLYFNLRDFRDFLKDEEGRKEDPNGRAHRIISKLQQQKIAQLKACASGHNSSLA